MKAPGTPDTSLFLRNIFEFGHQWYVSFRVEDNVAKRKEENAKENDKRIGVDLGVSNLIALSNGEIISNSRLAKQQQVDKIKLLQRKLSRKKKGCKNREKAKLILAEARRKVRRQRYNFAHKLSLRLASKNHLLVFEDLRITGMIKSRNLASAIMDATRGKLRQLTAYKVKKRVGK